ncbi:MAG: hypothetical protein ACE5J9_07475 [Methanosarcinales archaeon]
MCLNSNIAKNAKTSEYLENGNNLKMAVLQEWHDQRMLERAVLWKG